MYIVISVIIIFFYSVPNSKNVALAFTFLNYSIQFKLTHFL